MQTTTHGRRQSQDHEEAVLAVRVQPGRCLGGELHGRRARLLGCLLAGVILLAAPPLASAKPRPVFGPFATVDQSFTSVYNLGADINECCRYVAQTFTAGLNGVLVGVNINVIDIQPDMSPRLRVAIHRVENGFPTRTVLGSVVLKQDNAPLSQLIILARPIPINEGTQYAIVVSYNGAPRPGAGQSQGIWNGATGDQYPSGGLYFSLDNGSSWFPAPGGDVHFRTYVRAARR